MPRPVLVTWLALAVLLLSAANLVSAAQVWLRTTYLAGLKLAVPPTYLGLSGFVWGIVLAAATVGLLRLRPWGRWLTLGAVSLVHLQAWIDRLVFDRSAFARQVWPWEAAVSLVSLVLTWGILWRPRIRKAFGGGTQSRR
jgi:hypothetical protein